MKAGKEDYQQLGNDFRREKGTFNPREFFMVVL
jgi:hypothetical protein